MSPCASSDKSVSRNRALRSEDPPQPCLRVAGNAELGGVGCKVARARDHRTAEGLRARSAGARRRWSPRSVRTTSPVAATPRRPPLSRKIPRCRSRPRRAHADVAWPRSKLNSVRSPALAVALRRAPRLPQIPPSRSRPSHLVARKPRRAARARGPVHAGVAQPARRRRGPMHESAGEIIRGTSRRSAGAADRTYAAQTRLANTPPCRSRPRAGARHCGAPRCAAQAANPLVLPMEHALRPCHLSPSHGAPEARTCGRNPASPLARAGRRRPMWRSQRAAPKSRCMSSSRANRHLRPFA